MNEPPQADRNRCAWAQGSENYLRYHDLEWGVPVHDDNTLFEFIVLEGAQAGLSWSTILNKREAYRRAFDHFDPRKVAHFTARQRDQLVLNKAIVRNRAKIDAAITNARAVLSIQQEFGSLDNYLWRFVNGEPIQNHWTNAEEIPNRTVHSDTLSKDLKQRGFKFVGPIICYAFMQAVGMVNDHTIDCFRYATCAAVATNDA